MNLSEKILELRKQNGMSQEDLAEKLNVSRQSISRWENGSSQPDILNLSQLTKLFNVKADYLINDEYENDKDVSTSVKTERQTKNSNLKIISICITTFGLIGNFLLNIFSRFISVSIPYITYNNIGEKIYTWGELKGYSYKYFIQQYSLEFVVTLFFILTVVGVFIAFLNLIKNRSILDF